MLPAPEAVTVSAQEMPGRQQPVSSGPSHLLWCPQVVLPQSFNPILGSVEGWLIGVSLLPSGWMTYTGGVLILIASASVLVASHLRAEVPFSHAGQHRET